MFPRSKRPLGLKLLETGELANGAGHTIKLKVKVGLSLGEPTFTNAASMSW
jgi:hypothetical protein